MNAQRGWFGVAMYQGSNDTNMGTLWRSTYIYGGKALYTVGRKYRGQAGDTVDATRHVPYTHFEHFSDFIKFKPKQAKIIGVEINEKAIPLSRFCHPLNAIYILGNESYGIHENNLRLCDQIVYVETTLPICLNVAVAGSIIIADRLQKGVYQR